MAVVAKSVLVAVKSDGRGSVLSRVAAGRHRHLRFVLDTQHSAEPRRHPMLREFDGVAGAIRWVGKDHIVRKGCQRLGEGERRLAMDSRQASGAEGFDVFLQGAEAPRILFNEIRPHRAAGEGFESERAGAGVQIENTRLGDVQLEYAHPGLAYPIQCRPHQRATRRVYSPTSPATGDYAHGGWGAGSGKWEAGSGKCRLGF